MRTFRVHLAIDHDTSMGRGIAVGAARYVRESGLPWTFHVVDRLAVRLGEHTTPATADGLIGAAHHDWVIDPWRQDSLHRVVNISRSSDLQGAGNVTCDDAAIGQLAAEHLLSKSITSFAFIGPTRAGLRCTAFLDTVRRAGYHAKRLEVPLGDAFAKQRVAALPRPCGILAFNDVVATQVLTAALDSGLAVPQDVAVIGVDNDEFQMVFAPMDLTSVDPDFERVGHEAAAALDRVFQGGEPPAKPLRIPPKGLVERDSTDFPGIRDELVVAAARLIRKRACKGGTVADIAGALPITYRTLDRRFQAVFGHSMHEQITEVRLREAAFLLTQTPLPLHEIARRVGYTNVKHFSTVFRKHVGTPPSAYRHER